MAALLFLTVHILPFVLYVLMLVHAVVCVVERYVVQGSMPTIEIQRRLFVQVTTYKFSFSICLLRLFGAF